MIAAIVLGSSGGLLQSLLMLLIVGFCFGLIWWFGNWTIGKMGAPSIVATIWTGIFILLLIVVVINFLLGLGGHSFVTW